MLHTGLPKAPKLFSPSTFLTHKLRIYILLQTFRFAMQGKEGLLVLRMINKSNKKEQNDLGISLEWQRDKVLQDRLILPG